MRILHVIPSIADRYGGPSAALRGMATAVADRGVHVAVATTDADGPGRLAVPLHEPVVENGVEYRYFPRTLPIEWKPSLALTRWLANSVRNYDVVHVHALFSYATIPGCRLARRAGVPYVLRTLGTLGAWSLDRRGWKKRPYLALIERNHLAHAAAIHVTSHVEAEAVSALGYARGVRVVALGVDMAEAAPERTADRAGPLKLLFLSRLHPGKGIPLLFDAIAALPTEGRPVSLTIAGRGAPGYERELRSLCSVHGMSDFVTFVGHVEGPEKAALLAAADVFMLPSSHENFGIAVAEALAAGLPVIISDQVGLAAEVAAAGAGIVTPLDASRIAAAVEVMRTDTPLRLTMGNRARALALRSYSWSAAADALLALYREVLGAAAVPVGGR